MLVGPDGKTPIKSDLPEKVFRAGGLKISTSLTPDMLLSRAVQGARQMIAGQTYQQAMQSGSGPWEAQQAAQTASASVSDPFILEPAAMAVFMYLAREIEFRDRVLKAINDRLVRLGASPVDLSHLYPESDGHHEKSECSEGDRCPTCFVSRACGCECDDPSQDSVCKTTNASPDCSRCDKVAPEKRDECPECGTDGGPSW